MAGVTNQQARREDPTIKSNHKSSKRRFMNLTINDLHLHLQWGTPHNIFDTCF